MLFGTIQIFEEVENFALFARRVYMNFITFSDPVEKFSYSICGLAHFTSQPFIHILFLNTSVLMVISRSPRLRSEYETSQEAFVSKVEIFSRYLSHCSLVGQTELVTQSEMDSILR